ncbi:MAG: hypothetical protein ACRD0L_07040, partial [Acidimicrobiales bacterium]
GISMKQWHQILATPGVAVAAPVENVGYVLLYGAVDLTVPVSHSAIQIYRVKVTWHAANGLSSFSAADGYVYVTKARFYENTGPSQVGASEVCWHYVPDIPSSPLALDAGLSCFSTTTPGISSLNGAPPGMIERFQSPILVAGIDPHEEALLLHLPRTVVWGQHLREGEGFLPPPGGLPLPMQQVPVLASTRTFLDDTVSGEVQALRIPSG